MSQGGISSLDFHCTPQPNLIALPSRDNPIYMGYQIHTDETGMDHTGTDSKGKRVHLLDRSTRGSLEGGGGGDRHPD